MTKPNVVIHKHLSEVSEAMTLLDQAAVIRAVEVLSVVKRTGGRVWLFGNGGSHSTAGHFANDLLKMAHISAVCLGDMSASLLAFGNDNGWGNMYVDPLKEMCKQGDGVVGISCSGNSENVLNAMQWAQDNGVLTIGLTGLSNDSLMDTLKPEALVHVPVPDIRVQEDVHLMVCHAIVRALQEEGGSE